MKKNMGNADKWVRIFVAIIIAVLYYTGVIEGTVALTLLIFATIFVLTSLFSFCPLYWPFGINTKKK
jgi:hypothetical protein